MKCFTDNELQAILDKARRGGRADAFKAVAAHLADTAADFREMASHVDIPDKNHFLRTDAVLKRDDYLGKAQLLDGQAMHIRGFA